MSHSLAVEFRPYLESVPYAARLEGENIVFDKLLATKDAKGRIHVPKRLRREDLSEIRDQLLQIQTTEHALLFASRYGPLYKQGEDACALGMHDFEKLRDFVRQALLSPDKDALDIGWLLSVELQQGSPVLGFVRCESVAEAVKAILFLDRLRGNQWQSCDECGKVFEKGQGRVRRYCSQKCGGLQAARAYKERTKKARLTTPPVAS